MWVIHTSKCLDSVYSTLFHSKESHQWLVSDSGRTVQPIYICCVCRARSASKCFKIFHCYIHFDLFILHAVEIKITLSGAIIQQNTSVIITQLSSGVHLIIIYIFFPRNGGPESCSTLFGILLLLVCRLIHRNSGMIPNRVQIIWIGRFVKAKQFPTVNRVFDPVRLV